MADYTLEGFKWGSALDGTGAGDVTWSLATANHSSQAYQYTGFLTGAFQQQVEKAFARWASVANIHFVESADTPNNDIRLGLNAIDGLGSTLGETDTTYSAGVALSADIEFDSGEGWHVDTNGNLVSSQGVNFYDVALHEIGHSLGLNHYNLAPAIMNAVINPSVTDLQTSDIDGIQAVYGPATGAVAAGPTMRITTMTAGAMGVEWHSAGTANLTGTSGQGDLLWVSNGNVNDWHLAAGQFVSATQSNGHMGAEWSLAGTGDFNGDGKSDLFWVDNSGGAAVWTMDGANVAAAAVTQGHMGPEWHVAGFGDVNGDGKAEAVWVDSANDVDIWTLSGSNLTGAPMSDGHMGTEWSLAGIGDLNGDGEADLVWSRSDGELAFWFMDGAHVTSVATMLGKTDGSHIAAVKDFNGDGFADLLWENSTSTGDIWLMQGASMKANDQLTGALGTEWSFAGAQDVTNEGTPDLMFASNGRALVQDLAPSKTA